MIIELLNGTRFDIADYDLKRLFHYVPSATIDHETTSVDGGSDIITNSKLNNRTIKVELLYISQDIYDYYLLRDELNNLFMRVEPFYIIFKREPYKRWLVKTADQFEIPPHPHMQSFTVEFVTLKNYAESVGTTMDLQAFKEWDADLWGWGMGLDWDKTYQYEFTTSSFTVDNVGNAIVDPRQHELEIIIKATASSYIQLVNNTTGETYRYNGALSANDTLVIKGVRTLKNGVSAFKNTNHKLLSLTPGINAFTVTGGTIQNIKFNFRFLYK